MNKNQGSFRDPSGYVFQKNNRIFRSINACYLDHFNYLLDSGLYDNLVKKGFLLPFQETDENVEGASKTVEAEKLPFISYPYEWSFQQLKDAALLTLSIQKIALKYGMILKDASVYNIQFHRGKPVFIDLLSFEIYREGTPWNAYRQFISHFYGPLLLMSRIDLRYRNLFQCFIDGFPVDFISKSLPWRTRLNPNIQIHVHLHAKMIKKHENTSGRKDKLQVDNKAFTVKAQQNMAEVLFDMTKAIKPPVQITEWGDYYNDTNYDDDSFKKKKEIIEGICRRTNPEIACDFGANCGEFSRVLAQYSKIVLSPDIDPVAVDRNYVTIKKNGETNIYPIIQDLCNPSPGIGWMNQERLSFLERAQCDLAVALAIIHHLCIGNNLPLEYVAQLFHRVSPNLILEFVPKEDSQVARLLSSREDIFPDYSLEHCIEVFGKYYAKCEKHPIAGTCRTILFFSS